MEPSLDERYAHDPSFHWCKQVYNFINRHKLLVEFISVFFAALLALYFTIWQQERAGRNAALKKVSAAGIEASYNASRLHQIAKLPRINNVFVVTFAYPDATILTTCLQDERVLETFTDAEVAFLYRYIANIESLRISLPFHQRMATDRENASQPGASDLVQGGISSSAEEFAADSALAFVILSSQNPRLRHVFPNEPKLNSLQHRKLQFLDAVKTGKIKFTPGAVDIPPELVLPIDR